MSESASKSTILKKRCVVYTRKSTEEGLDMAYNSLDAQRDACQAYIASQKQEGWVLLPTRYDDGGVSGSTLERPALDKLLNDMREDKIDTVVVYKVDRLSRSLMDFAKLMDIFDRHQVSFVSVTQHFNTTHSMGRLTLNILLSFAQFEREVIGERIRDKFAASKRKGMWMGGVLPLGYQVKDRQLHIVEAEAKTVQLIFALFLKTQSVMQIVRDLPAMGIISKKRISKKGRVFGGTPLDRSAVYKILKNPIYIGKIKHKETLYDGQHKAIINQETWDKTQAILSRGVKARSVKTKRADRAILIDLLKCGGCYRAMTPTYTSKHQGRRLYRYYAASGYKKGRCPDCPVKQVNADLAEKAVLQQLQYWITRPEMMSKTYQAAKVQDPSVTENSIHEALQNLMPVWERLFPAEQKRLLSLVIDQVILHPDHLDVQIKADGLANLVSTLSSHTRSQNQEAVPKGARGK